MTNYFALLGLPETLVLDPDAVESAWHEAIRETSAASEDTLINLNEARATLADIARRLAHWLELKRTGGSLYRSIDPSLMDLFSAISPVLESTDLLIARLRKASTALTRAALTREAISAQLSVQERLRQIQSAKLVLAEQFPALESAAESGDLAPSWKCLGQLKFLNRWEAQCRERLLALIEL